MRLPATARRSRLVPVALLVVLVVFAVSASARPDLQSDPPAAEAVAAPDSSPATAPDGAGGPPERLLVKFADGAPPQAQSDTVAGVGATRVGVVRDLGVKVVTVPAARADTALTAMRGRSDVVFAERDSVLEPQEQLPNDPYFLNSGAWNLGGGAWGWYVTHTTQAWDVTEGDPNVVIAILDTGIKTQGLDDFNGQIASTWNVLNNSTDATSNAGDHGTYVAGVAALAADNGAGNAGYCPKCRLMIVQVGTDSGASISSIASGLTYAADHGARVANISWGTSSDSSTLQSAIKYAHDKGLVITASAGNSNCDCVSYPAADQGVLGVAGVSDAAGDKQGDSNYGSWVKLAAPEGDMTAWPSINGAPGYGSVGGTSVAAPAVAGIAGLLFSHAPSLTNTQVEQALESSAAPVKFTLAYGRVDAMGALQSLGAGDPQPSSPPVQTSAPRIYYEVNGLPSLAPLANAPQVGQVLVRGIGGWSGSAGLSVSNLQWQRCTSAGASCTSLGNLSTYTVQSADTGYAIKLAFTISNAIGSVPVSVLTQPVGGTSTTTTTTSTAAPSNTVVPTISGTPQAGQTLTATTGSWSGSPTTYSFEWRSCDSAGGSCTAIAGGGGAAAYLVQTADVGRTLRVAVTASNGGGSTTAVSAPTTVVTSAASATTTTTTTTTTTSTSTTSTTPTTTTSSPATTTQTFSGALNPQNQSRTFSVAVGAGVASAKLSFSKCSSLTLGLSNGASQAGPSVVSLDATVASGTYSYTVSGGKCAFTLTVTAPAP